MKKRKLWRRQPPPTSSRYTASQLRHARLAVSALFFTNGAVFANIVPRFPELKQIHDLDNATYGLALAAFPAGGIIAGIASAPLIRRFGSAPVAAVCMIATALALALAGMAPTSLLFALGMFIGGVCDASTDVGQNAHALLVQRHYGRSIINTFHAIWSVGAASGGLMAAGAIWLGLPVAWHMLISGLLCATAALLAWHFCLPGRADVPEITETPAETEAKATPGTPEDVAPLTFRTIVQLAALVLIATMGGLIEDAGSSWATLYVHQLGAVSSLAAIGYIGLVGSQFVGRLLGDSLVNRWGRRTVAQGGAALIAIGMGQALLFPNVVGTVVGFALAGFGSATLVPAAMQQADELPGFKPNTGLTIISWLMRIGFLTSPPIVGMVADNFGLRIGLCVVPFAGVTVLLLSWALTSRAYPAHTPRARL